MINCTKITDRQRALFKLYGARGYPTVVYLSPNGRIVDRMRSRCPADVAKQLNRIEGKASPERVLKGILKKKGHPWNSIRAAIRGLSSDRLEDRDRATRDLNDMKLFLQATLRIAARSKDPEVRARIKRLLEK